MNLLEKTKQVLNDLKLEPDMLKDQHFAVDEEMLRKIIEIADLHKSDMVLEIGPGLGNLTSYLVISDVTAIELDRRFEKILKEYPVKLIIGDALVEMKKIGFNKIVSNIPYSLSESLLRVLMNRSFDLAVLTVPSGFYCNLKGKSRLAYSVSCFFDVKKISEYPEEAFYPKPKTKTTLIKIIPLNDKFYKKHPKRRVMNLVLKHPGRKLKKALTEAYVEIFGFSKKETDKYYENVEVKILEKRVNDVKDLESIEEMILLP